MNNNINIIPGLKMRNLTAIIAENGGFEALKNQHIKLESSVFMPLCIENVDGLFEIQSVLQGDVFATISVAHYGEQNGDAMRDPEVCFHVMVDKTSGHPLYLPIYYRNDYVGVEERIKEFTAAALIRMRSLCGFTNMWDSNIMDQGFVGQPNVARGVAVWKT